MDIITNRQALAHMPVKELAVFLNNIAESPVSSSVDYEKWLNSDITVSIFDVTGKPGIYHEKGKKIRCRILGQEAAFGEVFVRFAVIDTDGEIGVYTAPIERFETPEG